MANRNFTSERVYSFHGKLVQLYAQVKFGATGAPTLQQWNPVTRAFSAAPSTGWRGVKSISRTSQGLFVVTLMDAYNQLIDVDVSFDTTGVSGQPLPAAPNCYVYGSGPTTSVNDSIATNTGGTFTLALFNDTNSPAVTDPASGEIMLLGITLSDSMAL